MSTTISLRSTQAHVRSRRHSKPRQNEETVQAGMDREYLICLARAFTSFGALYPRTEDDFCAAARALHVDAKLIYGHDRHRIFCQFQDHKSLTSETYAIDGHGMLELSNLGEVCRIHNSVLNYDITSQSATEELEDLMHSKKIYGTPAIRLALIFLLSAIICSLAFDGSVLDMTAAGVGAVIIYCPQLFMGPKDLTLGKTVEFTATIFVSFIAHTLSSLTRDLFCYSAISSAVLSSILPIYLLQQGSFKTFSTRGTFSTGISDTITAIGRTASLALALKIGVSLYLFSSGASPSINSSAMFSHYTTNLSAGTFFSTKSPVAFDPEFSAISAKLVSQHITSYILGTVQDCSRPPTELWYLQPFPSTARHTLVPFFALILSTFHSQHLLSVQTLIMTLISCTAYAAHNFIHTLIGSGPTTAPAALQSFIAALALGLLYTILIARTQSWGTSITYNVSIPGVMILILLGIANSGALMRGICLRLAFDMFLVAHSVALGVLIGEALVSTSDEENFLIDALEEAEQELHLHDAFIVGIL